MKLANALVEKPSWQVTGDSSQELYKKLKFLDLVSRKCI